MRIMVFYDEGCCNTNKLLRFILEWYCCVDVMTFVDFTRFCFWATTQKFVVDNIHNYDLVVMATEKRHYKTLLRKITNCRTKQFINYSTIRRKLSIQRFRKPVRFYMEGKEYLNLDNIDMSKIKFF